MSKLFSRAVGAVFLLSLAACSTGGSDDAAPTSVAPTVTTVPECGAAREVAAVLAGIDLSDREGIEALPDQLAKLSDVVPAELDGDVAILSSAVGGLVDVLQKFDFDIAAIEADADGQLYLAELDRPEVVAAAQNIQRWIDLSCA